MTIFPLLILYAGAAFLAWLITGGVRRFALDRNMLDYPNERSSHTVPMPRGGGLSIALIMVISILFLWLTGHLPARLFYAFEGGAIFVSLIGWLDDRHSLPAILRGMSYFLAAIWSVCWLSGLGAGWTPAALVMYGMVILSIAWLINLYNFMDGTDGLAATQGVCTGLWAGILLIPGTIYGLPALSLLLSGACAGFLFWNWPPARVFMGDVGSCVIGFVFGSLALASHVNGLLPASVWLILLSLFVTDTTLTLLKRILGGEQWYRAHRQHAYQLATRIGLDHRRLNNAVIMINVLILMPSAYLATQFRQYQWWLAAVVYLLSAGMWLFIQSKYLTVTRTMRTE